MPSWEMRDEYTYLLRTELRYNRRRSVATFRVDRLLRSGDWTTLILDHCQTPIPSDVSEEWAEHLAGALSSCMTDSGVQLQLVWPEQRHQRQ